MTTRSLLVPVIQRDDYTVAYEYSDFMVFGHVDVRRWGVEVAKRLREDVAAACALSDEPIYSLEVPEDPRQPKFLKMCGFHPIGEAENIHGQTVTLYERK